MIFEDSFLQQGEQGGKDAANQLWLSIRDYVSTQFPNLQSPKILTRLYANFKGLADVCVRAGIIERASVLEDFARGFNGSRLLFDFVDVGSGKDRADDKIAGRCYSYEDLQGLECRLLGSVLTFRSKKKSLK